MDARFTAQVFSEAFRWPAAKQQFGDEQFAHPLGIKPSRLPPRTVEHPDDFTAGNIGRTLAGTAGSTIAGATIGGALGGVPGAAVGTLGAFAGPHISDAIQRGRYNAETSELDRQGEINHRLALNNELEDVSEEEAAQVRNFLATLRHGR